MPDRCVSSEPRKDLAMYPDRLSAIASAAYNRGARAATHNLGGLHADIHHATKFGQRLAPEQLDTRTWECLLGKHRTDEPIQPLKL